MIQFDDRREREQRASLCFEDGLLDVGIGVGLLILGFFTMLGLGAVAGAYLAALIPIVNALKRIVTMPRMHHLDFLPDPDTRERVRRVKTVVSIAMGILVALGALAFFTSWIMPAPVSSWLRENAIMVFGLLLAALFVLLGWGTATGRPRVYAAVTAAALVVGHWFDMSPSWFFVLLGAVVAAGGTSALVRFVHVYPRQNGGRIRERHYRLIPGRLEE
ncbi:MAG: hypothetical protein C4574_07245 [Candidatus Latescibacterota bacterium]|jgi:hypothetical protein|nr:MAG: hypothetical protein C4574_07245 [Candidatus Latescibacterota bacterium]